MNRHNIGRRDFLKLAAIAAAGMGLAACAPQVTTAPQPTKVSEATNPPAAVSTTAPTKGLVTIRIHHRIGGECDNWTGLATKFNEQNPGIKVVPECFPGADYFQKLNTLAAGGTLGDILWVSSIEGYYRMAASGVIAPLDDLVSASKFDLSQLYSTCVESAKLKGKLYGIPQLAHPGRVGLYYNKPVFDAAKVDYPKDTWTYDDLLATAQKLTDSKNGVWGFLDTERSYFTVLVYLRAWGGDVINNDGTKCPLDSAESKAGLQYISDLYNKYHVAPKPGASALGPQQLFPSNKLAMYQSGFWGNFVRDFVKEGTWGVVPMPIGPTKKRGSMFESDPVCLVSSSKNKSEAFQWMTTVVSKEAQLNYFQKTGSPSSRPDVMDSSQVQADMNMKVFGGVMSNALPLVLPANFRETEYFKYIGEGLSAVWLGESTLDQVIGPVTKGAQDILDKPPLTGS